MKKLIWASGFCAVADTASAHAFKAGAGHYEAFIEGTSVVLFWPPTLAAMLTLGILVSLWRAEGMVAIWPYMIIGQLIGFGLSSFNLEGTATLPYFLGLLTAIFAIFALTTNKSLIAIIAAFSGLSVIMSALEGHPIGSLSLAIYLGIFVAANLGVAVSAGLVAMSIAKIKSSWAVLGWKIIASWLAAMIILQLAFAFRA